MQEDPAAGSEETSRAAQTKVLMTALVVAVGAAAAFAILWMRDREPTPVDITSYLGSEQGDVARTATAALEGLMNYDEATLDERRADLEPHLTGALRDQYDEVIGGLDQALQQTGATAEAEIISGPDVSFTSAVRAQAVARVVQQVTYTEREIPSTGFFVLRLTLVPEDERWKVENFEVLSHHRSEE